MAVRNIRWTFEKSLEKYLILKCNASRCHDLMTFCTFCCKLFFKASNTIDISIVRYDEWFTAHLLFANDTLKTFVMPFFCLVFHFLHPGSKSIATSITSAGKLSIVTRGTKYEGVFCCKGLFHQRCIAFFTSEACLMPVHVLVRHVFWIKSDLGPTALTGVGKILLITGNATRMIIGQNIAISG